MKTIEYNPAGSRTILLVDDDKNLRKLMHTILTHDGYHVEMARDGVEAVSKYIEHMETISLVVMDVTMPHKDGITASYEIKDLNPDATILFMSAYSEMPLDQIPNVDFIKKPMSCSELSQKVSELMARVAADAYVR